MTFIEIIFWIIEFNFSVLIFFSLSHRALARLSNKSIPKEKEKPYHMSHWWYHQKFIFHFCSSSFRLFVLFIFVKSKTSRRLSFLHQKPESSYYQHAVRLPKTKPFWSLHHEKEKKIELFKWTFWVDRNKHFVVIARRDISKGSTVNLVSRRSDHPSSFYRRVSERKIRFHFN